MKKVIVQTFLRRSLVELRKAFDLAKSPELKERIKKGLNEIESILADLLYDFETGEGAELWQMEYWARSKAEEEEKGKGSPEK